MRSPSRLAGWPVGLLALFATMFLACSAEEPALPSQVGATSTPAPVASSTPFPATLTAAPASVPTRMAALAVGVLKEVDGCLRVGTPDHNGYLLVWPPDQHEVTRHGSSVHVVDLHPAYGAGQSSATWQIGETVELGGGSISSLSGVPHEDLPGHCAGPYWLAGSLVSDEERTLEEAVPFRPSRPAPPGRQIHLHVAS